MEKSQILFNLYIIPTTLPGENDSHQLPTMVQPFRRHFKFEFIPEVRLLSKIFFITTCVTNCQT